LASHLKKNTVKVDRKSNVGLHHLALTVASIEALDELHERFKKVEGIASKLAFCCLGKHMMISEPSGNRLEFIYRPNHKFGI
tara:strand:- start:14 stop:259 length:246 start_codon:yes stop_codon:yes gene_type:complete